MRSLITIFFTISCSLYAQVLDNDETVTRADSLRGMLTPLRTCFDVTHYALDVKIDTVTRRISGSNTITLVAMQDFTRLQIDLFDHYTIDRIEWKGKKLKFSREFNAVFVEFPETIRKSSRQSFTVFYSGTPIVAKNPPWDGGFIWSRDKSGNPWIAVACQGFGASSWWPNKDHQSDEPDSMLISITVPKGLTNVSNGRLRKQKDVGSGWTRFDYAVTYPINNYNVTFNVGKFAYFGETYTSYDGQKLTCDYYVMPYNLEKAKVQFAQVKGMMDAFEKSFGKYAFYRDGYKLVESPHLGMEHQSAVAYGNNYVNGYKGTGQAAEGLLFDFIIIHETAHEWWGNAVGSNDLADMWIHESFGNYAETIYLEGVYDYPTSLRYINANKTLVKNDRPIIGPRGVNKEGSGDMYPKGGLMLNTLRSVINNDKFWFEILRGIQDTYRYKTIDADSIFNYVRLKTGTDYCYFFDQYLKHKALPKLDVALFKKGSTTTMRYRWTADVKSFRMPIRVTTTKDRYEWVAPTTEWQTMKLENLDPRDFKIEEDRFYVDKNISWMFFDERLQ